MWSRGGFLNQLSVFHYHFCPYPHQEKISWSRGGFGNKVSRTLSHDQNYVCPPPHNEKISWSHGEKKMEICPYLNKNKNKLSRGKKILDAPTPTSRKSRGLVVDLKIFHIVKNISVPTPTTKKISWSRGEKK